MPTTIAGLAAEFDTTVGTVSTLVDQLVELDGVEATLVDDRTLTDAAADTVREQLAAAPASAGAEELLAGVREAASRLAEAQQQAEEAAAVRDRAVVEALRAGGRVADIVDAAGLSRYRVYQIRDGRR